MDPRFYSIEYLDMLITQNRAAFIENGEAAIVVERKGFPTGLQAINGLVAAGELPVIRHELIPAAEELGRQAGCQIALIESRPGWAKELKRDGYEVFQTSIVKEL